MPDTVRILLASLAVLLATDGQSTVAQDATPRYFLIGNSLTWDTVPSLLDGDVQWHVDCGVSLPHIYHHPESPCVNTSTPWPKALRTRQYDVVSVQPHYRATLAEDVETISNWMKLQPDAVFVIHTGWAFHEQRATEFAAYAAPTEMVHSSGYIRALLSELRRLHPGRTIRQTFAQNLLAQAAEDIATRQAPVQDVQSLYRDAIHMTLDHGRYLMHNAMRRALGQPSSANGFASLDFDRKTWLDGILSLLHTSDADRRLLKQILSLDQIMDRDALSRNISDPALQKRVTALLPAIEQALQKHHSDQILADRVEAVGGRVVWSPVGPQWLYLATEDTGTELFDVITTVDLYNGNNPLKGRGGRNEAVTDDWLQCLSELQTLRRLDVSNCEIHGDGLRHISGIAGLRELNLTLTPVTDSALKHLSGLAELRTLGLASTQCNGTGFQYLSELRTLQSVNFHFTPLNDDGLKAIARIPIADRFWFAHTRFTDAGAASLAAMTGLKRCGIGSKDKGSSGAAVAALARLPLLDLSLLDNQASPEGLANAATIQTLKRLDVSYAPEVTDDSMPLVAELPQLEEFRLGAAQITDAGLLHLSRAAALKKLSLSGNKRVTEAGIQALKAARPDMQIEVF